jgi:hypothetical protein
MSSYNLGFTRAAQANADLRNFQYKFLRNDGAGTVNVASHAAGAGTTLVGVLQNKPNSGQAATIGVMGESKVVAGGALTVNTWITTNGSGRAAAATSGDNVIGMVLETAGADGDVVRAMIHPAWFNGNI